MKLFVKSCFAFLVVLVLFLLPLYGAAQVRSIEPNWEITKYGLFVHFVFGGEYGGMTPMGKSGGFPKNIDEFAESFDVQKFANDVEAMGFEYVIFTAWHANMGVLYPSKVMANYGFDQHDHYTSKRDLLGDIMDALALKGIKFSIYTHIFVGHDFHPQGSGYFMYDNKNGKITQDMINSGYVEAVNGNSKKWNDFTNEVFDEMSSRYGEKVFSYWFDGTWVPNSWVDKQRMMQTISKSNKICAFVANGTPSHGLPYSSKEVGSPAGNDYGFNSDYPPVYNEDVTTWPTYERNIALIQGGNWWASTSGNPKFSAEDVYRFTVLVASTNTGGGVSWSFSPFVNGEWEGDMLERMKKAYSYLKPVEEAIKNTNPSKSFVTKEGTKISTLGNGFVATRSANGEFEYIHVLNNRNENFLKLPLAADGRVYDIAFLLAKDKQVDLKYNERGYMLTLPEGETWDSLNTVFKLHLSEFTINASAAETKLRNPWSNSKFKIEDAAGKSVDYILVNDSVVFDTEVGHSYFLSRSKSPVLKLGKIESYPDSVFLFFSEPLIVTEPINGFTFKVNSQVVDISQIRYVDSTASMVVSLASPINKNDTITLSYIGNEIVSEAGLVLDLFDNVLINNLLEGSSPRLISAVTTYNGSEIQLVFNKKIDPGSIRSSTFEITDTVDNKSVQVSSVGIAGSDSTRIILSLTNRVYLENKLELNYSGNEVLSYDGGLLSEIDSYRIINESQGKSPMIVANTITNQGLGIEIVFNKTLKNIHTQKEYFTISINGNRASIRSINGDNETIRFFLKNPIRHGDEVFAGFSGGVITATDDAELKEIKSLAFVNDLPAPKYQTVPGKVEAESYAIQDGVKTQATSDAGGGLNVGWIDANDWMDYAIDVAEPGNYLIDFRVSGQSEGLIEIQITQGNDLVDLISETLPNTGGWQNWKTVSSNVNLPKGKHYLRVNVLKGGFNFNWMQLTKNSVQSPELLSAILKTNAKAIVLTFDKPIVSPSVSDTAYFDVFADGLRFPLRNIIKSSNSSAFTINLKSAIPASANSITISYNGFTISSEDQGMLLPFNDFPISVSTEINQNQFFKEVQIYPNPVTDMLYVCSDSFDPVVAYFIDMEGKTVLKSKINSTGVIKEIPVKLFSGNYLLVLKNQYGEQISRMLTITNN